MLPPLHPQLIDRLESAGLTVTGHPMAYYAAPPKAPGDESIIAHAAFPITGEAPPAPRFRGHRPAGDHARGDPDRAAPARQVWR